MYANIWMIKNGFCYLAVLRKMIKYVKFVILLFLFNQQLTILSSHVCKLNEKFLLTIPPGLIEI